MDNDTFKTPEGHRGAILLAVVGLALAAVIGLVAFRVQRSIAPGNQQQVEEIEELGQPRLSTEVVLSGLNHPWDMAFLPDDTLLFTERGGTISKLDNGSRVVIHKENGVRAVGEGGMLGLAVDPEFKDNNYIYACYNTKSDVRVSRWTVNEDVSELSEKTDIITGIPSAQSGRHSGCRTRFGADGYLWVGTGDAAKGENPQDPKSLGGKILKVDREGEPALDNLDPPFDPIIFSYGHRNVQGLAMFEQQQGESYGFSIEHGPDVNDELNPLVPGNFGWDPVPGYNESVPMTDTEKFPEAVTAIWSSGDPTLAPSGATIITGEKWGTYQDGVAMAVLRAAHLRVFVIDLAGDITEEKVLLDGKYGRLRSVILDSNDNMYVSTDNGGGADQIIRIIPSLSQDNSQN